MLVLHNKSKTQAREVEDLENEVHSVNHSFLCLLKFLKPAIILGEI